MENEIEVNGKKYVLKDSIKTKAKSKNGKEYAIVRTYSAGVFAGYIEKENGKEITLSDCRTLWYWKGANCLLDLATYGTKEPNACKFSTAVESLRVKEAIEIIPCTEEGKKSITEVKEWKA